MSTKQSAPKAPNYAPIIAAQQQAATNAQNLANTQYTLFSQQAAQDRATTNSAVNAESNQSGMNTGQATADMARYNSTYVPAENQYLQNAESYTDPAQVENRAAAAAGDVTQQFDVARGNAQRQLESYGIDPTQTRSQALDAQMGTQEAAARASAMNTSRRQDALTGQQMLGTAIQQGQTDAARGLQESQLGTSQAAQGAGLDLAATASEANTLGTTPQYTSLANSSLSGAASTTNQQYQNELSTVQANNASSSGLGSLLGTGLGFLAKSYDSNGPLATGVGNAVKGIGSSIAGIFAADGGAVPDDGELAAQSHSAIPGRRGTTEDSQGIRVTREMSPSRGVQTDDVPARLNAGEFVLPRDTVDWYGQRFLQNLIRKGAQESAGAARPRVAALPVERPTVSSGALMVRR